MSQEYRFQTIGTATVIVSVASGRVDVRESTDEVVISISGAEDQFDVEQTGNTISITAERKRGLFSSSSHVEIGLPPGSDFELSGASVDAFIEVPLGSVRSRTASGDISINDVRSLSARSASGDVRVAAVERDCDIALASGDFFGDHIGGDLNGSVASGDIRVESVEGRISVKSASGDVRVDRATGGEANIKSMSGTVAIGIAPRTRVHLNVNTLSGEIHTPKPSEQTEEPERSIRLNVKTVSGDIRLNRAD